MLVPCLSITTVSTYHVHIIEIRTVCEYYFFHWPISLLRVMLQKTFPFDSAHSLTQSTVTIILYPPLINGSTHSHTDHWHPLYMRSWLPRLRHNKLYAQHHQQTKPTGWKWRKYLLIPAALLPKTNNHLTGEYWWQPQLNICPSWWVWLFIFLLQSVPIYSRGNNIQIDLQQGKTMSIALPINPAVKTNKPHL